jgi:hypothetical protein
MMKRGVHAPKTSKTSVPPERKKGRRSLTEDAELDNQEALFFERLASVWHSVPGRDIRKIRATAISSPEQTFDSCRIQDPLARCFGKIATHVFAGIGTSSWLLVQPCS